jgi:putative RNA 2'-phosphotransferase
MNKDLVATSKFLSLVLRHKPEAIGLSLDANGWAEVDDLVRLANGNGHRLTREMIANIVASSEKQRFALDDSGARIRANQGHSIDVDLELKSLQPPGILYHGTAMRFIESIQQLGLQKRQRHHVHLSQDEDVAYVVGKRHGDPKVLIIRAEEMWRAGHPFYQSENGVWLTESVPAVFIDFPS